MRQSSQSKISALRFDKPDFRQMGRQVIAQRNPAFPEDKSAMSLSHASPSRYAASNAAILKGLDALTCMVSKTRDKRFPATSGSGTISAERFNPGILNVLLGATAVTIGRHRPPCQKPKACGACYRGRPDRHGCHRKKLPNRCFLAIRKDTLQFGDAPYPADRIMRGA